MEVGVCNESIIFLGIGLYIISSAADSILLQKMQNLLVHQ